MINGSTNTQTHLKKVVCSLTDIFSFFDALLNFKHST